MKIKTMGVVLSTLTIVTFAACRQNIPHEEKKEVVPNAIEVTLDREGSLVDLTRPAFLMGEEQMVYLGLKSRYELGLNEVEKTIPIQLSAKQGVIFQGWSWRYADDPVITYRNEEGAIIKDFIPHPYLQFTKDNRMLLNTAIKARLREGKSNKVLIKIKYATLKKEVPQLPDLDLLSKIVLPIKNERELQPVMAQIPKAKEEAQKAFLAGCIDPSGMAKAEVLLGDEWWGEKRIADQSVNNLYYAWYLHYKICEEIMRTINEEVGSKERRIEDLLAKIDRYKTEPHIDENIDEPMAIGIHQMEQEIERLEAVIKPYKGPQYVLSQNMEVWWRQKPPHTLGYKVF